MSNKTPKQNKRKNYLTRPVTNKMKSGQRNSQDLMGYLLLDLNDFESETAYAIWYMAIVLNLYMHNSSHRPTDGYGKAQQRETEHALYYFRSQGNSPHRIMHDQICKKKNNGKDTRKTSLLPRNKAFEKIVKNAESCTTLKKALSKLDSRGFPKLNKKVDGYLGEFLGKSGVRANNFVIYTQALQCINAGEELAELTTELQKRDVLPKTKAVPKKIKRLENKEVVKRINEIKLRFAQLKPPLVQVKSNDNIATKMFKQRSYNTTDIAKRCFKLNFKKLSLDTNTDNTCLYINLYPFAKLTEKIRNSSDYKEGVTNVIIGFLGGLINHHAKLKGLFLHIDRRQSFGFLRPTLSDVGSLRIRLSLGLEPEIFNSIVTDSLHDLDDLLAEYDFTATEKDRDPIVTKCFKCCNDKKRKETIIHNRMRSPHNQWQAFREAEYHLEDCKAKENYKDEAFKKYLTKFIVKDKTYTGPTLLNETKKKKTDTCNEETTIIFTVLNELLRYVLKYLTELDTVHKDDSLKHSYWHSLLKLYNNCDKAQELLQNLEKHEVTHLYAKANLLIEGILEYLISLDALEQIRKKINGEEINVAADLNKAIKNDVATSLVIPSNSIDVYFTDSGQQAIVAALLEMDMYLHTINKAAESNIYLFGDTYYEVEEFLKKVDGLQTFSEKNSTIVFTDITCTDKFIDKFVAKKFPKIEAVIIDITNNPDLDNPILKQQIVQLHKQKIWVVLVASSLKHEQLGLDKYQCGKIITLQPPKTKPLPDNIKEELQAVSDEAMHPSIASYLKIVHKVCHTKTMVEPTKKAPKSTNLKLYKPSADQIKTLQAMGLLYKQTKPIKVKPVSGNLEAFNQKIKFSLT